MTTRSADILGIGVSGACVLHCLAPALAVSVPVLGPALYRLAHFGHDHGANGLGANASFSSTFPDLYLSQATGFDPGSALGVHLALFAFAALFGTLALVLKPGARPAVWLAFAAGLSLLGFGMFFAANAAAATGFSVAGALVMAGAHFANAFRRA